MNNNYQLVQGSSGQPPQVPMHQPQNVFRYGEQTLWSTHLHQGSGAGAVGLARGQFRLFATPMGQQGQGFATALSIAETNMKQGAQIPANQAYDVFAIACHIGQSTAVGDASLGKSVNSAAAIQTLNQILSNGVLSWDFTQTQVDIAPIQVIGAAGGAFGSASISSGGGTAATATGTMNNGAGGCFMYQEFPVALPATSTFAILLRYGSRMGSLAKDQFSVFVKVIMYGYYKNSLVIG